MWRRSNLEPAKLGRILAKRKLQSFQNPKDERRLVQNIGIDCSHTAVECRFLLKFFRSNISETNFSKFIKNFKDWQTESRGSKPLHFSFMQLDLYFLTGIFLMTMFIINSTETTPYSVAQVRFVRLLQVTFLNLIFKFKIYQKALKQP